eukprot:CAMPEP_0172939180 /NCGR_PEP_ID=MMETSP1075-20121228/223400_1 /TAXON_ID=2916 /ORGANISM="Ceratium fusus, Strain PA161109" /LENGTH=115 /DNA_ID=CAMNT_0013800567 /DNA_START=14 /DNA_END=361 /DNA_ORIENTATION=+
MENYSIVSAAVAAQHVDAVTRLLQQPSHLSVRSSVKRKATHARKHHSKHNQATSSPETKQEKSSHARKHKSKHAQATSSPDTKRHQGIAATQKPRSEVELAPQRRGKTPSSRCWV